jgi:hypothetical protein
LALLQYILCITQSNINATLDQRSNPNPWLL